MLYRGTIIPFHDLHFRGRYDSPMRMIPGREMEWFPVTYRPEDLGVDGINIHARVAFKFDGDSYRETWRSNPGSAKIYARWISDGVELQQEFKAQLIRLYEMSYWLENWKHHCYYKNSLPERMRYYLPEILKKVQCPKCLQLTTLLVMPYDDSSSGWACTGCAPDFEKKFQYRKRQDEALKTLMEMSRQGELEGGHKENLDEG